MIEHPFKLFGLLGSAATVGYSWFVASAQEWISPTKEFTLLLTAIGGFIGVICYTLSIALDVMRKWREEREAKRKEIREIEDALCRKRRASLECPLLNAHPELTTYDERSDDQA